MGRAAVSIAVGLLFAAAAAAEPAHVGYPSSIIALGDSSSTGYNSNRPGLDAKENSWSTGDNPAVQSHYLRILAANPKIRGHNLNYARDGAPMRDLIRQAGTAAALKPDYVTILMGGNDLCGSQDTPLGAFRAQLVNALSALAHGAPNARILVDGLGKPSSYLDAIKANADARAAVTDGGPCDPQFDARGEPDPQRVAFVDQKVAMYEAQLLAGCAAFIHCRYAADNTTVELEDLSSDWGHPSVHGLAKRAASTWAAGFDFTDTSPPASKASRSGRKVTLTATDNAGVSGLEYRLAAKGAWIRYAKPVTVPKGKTLTWRAVDVNGNCEGTHSLKG